MGHRLILGKGTFSLGMRPAGNKNRVNQPLSRCLWLSHTELLCLPGLRGNRPSLTTRYPSAPLP